MGKKASSILEYLTNTRVSRRKFLEQIGVITVAGLINACTTLPKATPPAVEFTPLPSSENIIPTDQWNTFSPKQQLDALLENKIPQEIALTPQDNPTAKEEMGTLIARIASQIATNFHLQRENDLSITPTSKNYLYFVPDKEEAGNVLTSLGAPQSSIESWQSLDSPGGTYSTPGDPPETHSIIITGKPYIPIDNQDTPLFIAATARSFFGTILHELGHARAIHTNFGNNPNIQAVLSYPLSISTSSFHNPSSYDQSGYIIVAHGLDGNNQSKDLTLFADNEEMRNALYLKELLSNQDYNDTQIKSIMIGTYFNLATFNQDLLHQLNIDTTTWIIQSSRLNFGDLANWTKDSLQVNYPNFTLDHFGRIMFHANSASITLQSLHSDSQVEHYHQTIADILNEAKS